MDTFTPNAATYEWCENTFPELKSNGYEPTSPFTPSYNCIAWAAGSQDAFWWPLDYAPYFWPKDVTMSTELASFIMLYNKVGGYEACDNGSLEPGFEKVVIYVGSDSQVTHAARQLENGKWTSKLGSGFDIDHDNVEGLYGPLYGVAKQYMKRVRKA